MIENHVLFEFYTNGIYKDDIYYLEEHGVIVLAGIQPFEVHCHDIYGKTDRSLESILQSLRNAEDDKVLLGFTPTDKTVFSCREHREEDTTLFINRGGENRFRTEKGMFPELSHA